jgi:ribonucleoside-diphosphate reductase alpha chain
MERGELYVVNKYEELSEERKRQQAAGLLPEWMSTGGFQLFTEKYLYQAGSYREQVERIARTAAKHTYAPEKYADVFFKLIWNGWLSCSTPVLANMGTDRGLPVSCSGGVVGDSIEGFYSSRKETAILTKHGFGTSGYLGDIRPRGSAISVGGVASGVLPVIKGFVQDSQDVSQGSTRRGSFATYLPVEHGDFWEVITYLENHPDDLNIGWNIGDSFVHRLTSGDPDALARYQRMLKVKMVTGKGYFNFIDKINRARPPEYVNNGLTVKASNLCNEINLFSDEEHTFTCVLSSLNLAKYDEWKDTNACAEAIHFLDCVVSEFIERGSEVPGLANAVRATSKRRAHGLGVCGWHTLLQQRGVPFESLEAGWLNQEVFEKIRTEANKESIRLAWLYGAPEWCMPTGAQGLGTRRNTHLLAIAPTKSTALIMGGVSEGINPDPAMTYTQSSAGGEINRVNPVLLPLMKERGVYDKKHIQEMVDANGSVQGVDWLNEHEKRVFKTAFEINQQHVLRHAASRAKYLDQWQSLNLFFAGDASEEEISAVHKQAFLDENIRGLYYIYSSSGISAAKDECESCQ